MVIEGGATPPYHEEGGSPKDWEIKSKPLEEVAQEFTQEVESKGGQILEEYTFRIYFGGDHYLDFVPKQLVQTGDASIDNPNKEFVGQLEKLWSLLSQKGEGTMQIFLQYLERMEESSAGVGILKDRVMQALEPVSIFDRLQKESKKVEVQVEGESYVVDVDFDTDLHRSYIVIGKKDLKEIGEEKKGERYKVLVEHFGHSVTFLTPLMGQAIPNLLMAELDNRKQDLSNMIKRIQGDPPLPICFLNHDEKSITMDVHVIAREQQNKGFSFELVQYCAASYHLKTNKWGDVLEEKITFHPAKEFPKVEYEPDEAPPYDKEAYAHYRKVLLRDRGFFSRFFPF